MAAADVEATAAAMLSATPLPVAVTIVSQVESQNKQSTILACCCSIILVLFLLFASLLHEPLCLPHFRLFLPCLVFF